MNADKSSFPVSFGIVIGWILFSGLLSSLPIQSQSVQEQARVQYYQTMVEDKQLPFQQKETFFDSIISFYHSFQNPVLEHKYGLEKIKFYYDEGSYIEAYKAGLSIIDTLDNSDELTTEELLHKNLAHLIVAKSCSNMGMFNESISHLFSIIRQPDKTYTIEAYSYLGFVFMQMKQLDKSKYYNDLAMKFLSEAEDTAAKKSACVVYNNLAGYYYNIEQLDSALLYMNRSIEYYDYAEDVASKSYVYHNMAIIYQEMGEYAMAEDFFLKAIEMSDKEPYKQARYLQNFAFLLFESNKLEKAEKYYFQALRVAEESDAKQIKSAILMELSDLYHKKKQHQKAWEYLKEGVTLHDSIFSTQNMEKISVLSQQFDNYKISTEKNLLEKELQLAQLTNQKKNVVLGILIFFLLIISGTAFILIRRIHRNSVVSIEKETKVNEEVIRKEFETTLEEKNRKLATNALFLMKTDEIFAGLSENIKQLFITKDSETRKNIMKEMASVINSYNSGQGWEEFKLYFEQVHHSFYINLNKNNPNLSKMEQRLCALLVLNMNTKEIAQITNRSVRTIETLIYRIRKNLNIPAEEKTTQFLRTFLEE
jgi:tetratricopeptide (TPR) repeat protein/DNA-binding CsgD family transcriptional regulator